jgi:hypothetical protein
VKNTSHNEIIVTDEPNQRFTDGLPESCPASPQRVKDPGRDFLLLLVIELRKSKKKKSG